jgi:hypothetical protein
LPVRVVIGGRWSSSSNSNLVFLDQLFPSAIGSAGLYPY